MLNKQAEGQPRISEWACSFFASKLKGLFPFQARMNTKKTNQKKRERERRSKIQPCAFKTM